MAIAVGGWRRGYALLGVIVAVAVPLVWLLLRRRASTMGATPAPKAGGHLGLSFGEARKQTAFWLLAAIFFVAALGFEGLIVHFVGMLVEAGIDPQRAALTSSLIGVSILVSRLMVGLCVDRVFAPWIGAATFAASAAGCAIVAFAPVYPELAAILIGVAMGAEVDLVSYLVARYFGLRSYGAIYGAQYSAFLLGTGISPVLMGVLFDRLGNFHAAQGLAITCLVVAAFGMLALPRFDDHRNGLARTN